MGIRSVATEHRPTAEYRTPVDLGPAGCHFGHMPFTGEISKLTTPFPTWFATHQAESVFLIDTVPASEPKGPVLKQLRRFYPEPTDAALQNSITWHDRKPLS